MDAIALAGAKCAAVAKQLAPVAVEGSDMVTVDWSYARQPTAWVYWPECLILKNCAGEPTPLTSSRINDPQLGALGSSIGGVAVSPPCFFEMLSLVSLG